MDRPFKIRRLGHFGINSENIEASLRFYTELLGFKLSEPATDRTFFCRFGTDHHALAVFQKQFIEGMQPPQKPDITINQCTWQVQSAAEVSEATKYLQERGVKLWRSGRDPTGNWEVYLYDPEGHIHELYYGIYQIGWDGISPPRDYWKGIAVQGEMTLPVSSEYDELHALERSTGVAFGQGNRFSEPAPAAYEINGTTLRRPFKITKIAPVRLFIQDMARAVEFYANTMGFEITEEVPWRNRKCVFLRSNTEHHCLALYPVEWREELGFTPKSSLMSFGVQLANYDHLRSAVGYLREHGVRVETSIVPAELHPGIDYVAYAFDPDGFAVELSYYMEQVGWDGKPRPAEMRPKVTQDEWPEVVEAHSDSYKGETYLGSWG
jgi:catechol 2,3-dioxygenase-like lactoylglutathione lyase family enzyme